MPKNYYIILGIPSDSSHEDIKAAFRRLAKKFHPDHYGEERSPFQIIKEAYTVLGNPIRRKNYDTALHPPADSSQAATYHAHRPAAVEVEPLIPEKQPQTGRTKALEHTLQQPWSIFDDVFEHFLGGFTEQLPHSPQNAKSLSLDIPLTANQAKRGGNVSVSLPVQMHCPSCYQYGDAGHACWRCNSTGTLHGEKPVLINYPAGIKNNHTMLLRLAESGRQQLFLTVTFKVRAGNVLWPISPA